MSGKAEIFEIEATGFGGLPAVWVGGGFTNRSGRAGSATIVTTADGGKPRALKVLRRRSYHSGRHALVPIEKGFYLIKAEYAFPYNWMLRVFRVVGIRSIADHGRAGVEAVPVFEGPDQDECPVPELEVALDEASKKAVSGNDVLPYVQNDVTYGELFARFEKHLLPLVDQLKVLEYYNWKYWHNYFSEEELRAVRTTSRHKQRVDNLELIFPSFGSAVTDVLMWSKVLAGEYASFNLGYAQRNDLRRLRYRDGTRQYARGIYRVKLNLAACWEPQRAPGPVKLLRGRFAHAEILAAYAFHLELLNEMDGIKLPHAHMLGFDLAGEWLVLDVHVHEDSEPEVGLSSSGTTVFEVDSDRAAPLVFV